MEITFVDNTDFQNITRKMKPESRFSVSTEKQDAIDRYLELLKDGYHGLASFASKDEEEAFLKEMSLKSDIAIVFEWKDFLKAYLFSGAPSIQPPKVYLKVADQYRTLYDNGTEYDYNRFKKWIKWLPVGYYHVTKLAGGPPPQSVGQGLETLADSLGIEVEWEIRGNQLIYWRKGETCAKKEFLGGTCDGCTEDIRDICWTTDRHIY